MVRDSEHCTDCLRLGQLSCLRRIFTAILLFSNHAFATFSIRDKCKERDRLACIHSEARKRRFEHIVLADPAEAVTTIVPRQPLQPAMLFVQRRFDCGLLYIESADNADCVRLARVSRRWRHVNNRKVVWSRLL